MKMQLRTLALRFAIPFLAAGLAHGIAVAAPAAYVDFSPTTVRQGDPVRLSVSVSDGAQFGMTNVVLAPGVFTYPAGVTNSTTPPQINCGGAGIPTLVAVPGANTMSFSAPDVPWFGCSFYVYVDIAAPGTYTATLPPNAVSTDQGFAFSSLSGTVTVTPAQVVTNTNDSGPGSLRDAITFVNTNCTGPYVITFNISGTALIQPASALPPITCASTIVDGYSQPGTTRNAGPLGCVSPGVAVELSGAACGAGCNGLELANTGNVIKGLSIHSWAGSGIAISNNGSAEIYGNIIGSAPGGTSALGNGSGIILNSGYSSIGSSSVNPTPNTGTVAGDANLIVANAKGIAVSSGNVTIANNQLGGLANCGTGNGNGVGIDLGSGAFNSRIEGNFIRYGTGVGVAVDPAVVPSVKLYQNSIADNGGIGIDLANDGPNVNDDKTAPYDQDGIQNYPVITAIAFDGVNTRIDGVLKTSGTYNSSVEVYQNSQVRAGITEGETYLGTAPTSVDPLDSNGMIWTLLVPGNVDALSAAARFDSCGDGCNRSSEYSPTVTKASLVVVGPLLSIAPDRPESAQIVALVGISFRGYFRVTNVGDRTATFAATPFDFTNPEFSQAPTNQTICAGTLAVNSSCLIVVDFFPSTPGPSSGTLNVYSDSATPSSFTLKGYGLMPLQIRINTPATPAAGSATTATLEVVNPNPPTAPDLSAVSGVLTIPAGFVVDAEPTPSCPLDSSQDPTQHLVASGTTCTLYEAQLTAPAQPGPYTFVVGVAGVAMGSVGFGNTVAVQATVTVVPSNVTVSPTSLSFGSVLVGGTSAMQTVSINSSSRLPVAITSITLPAGYVLNSSTCGGAVGPGGCALLIAFAPTTTGTVNGALVINAGGAAYSVSLSGLGTLPLPTFAATLSSGSITFPQRALGTRSPPVAVTFTNTGTSPLPIRNVAVTGDFGYSSTCPIGIPLAVGANCSVSITFGPLVTGARDGALTILSDDAASPHVVTLSGVGIIVPTATLSVNSANLDFDTRNIGTTSPPQSVTVTNSGNAAMRLAFATASPFALATVPAGSSACGSTLQPGASCVVAVTFTPPSAGGFIGSLVFTSDATNPRVAIVLTGTGLLAPPPRALSLPLALDFGTQAVGVRGEAHGLVLSNGTAQLLTVTDVRVDGDFSVDDGCPTITGRGTCSLNLYFMPAARGLRSGLASILIAGDTLPYLVTLTGQGAPNPLPVLRVSPLRIGFGNSLIGPTGPKSTLKLTNPGEVPVLLGTIPPPGDFLVSSHCPASLAPGESCNVDVVFYPRLTGLRSTTLQIPSNAVDAPHLVELSGVGCSLPNAARARLTQLVCAP